jgi:predicted permease
MPNAWIQSTVQDIRHGFRVFRRHSAAFVSGVLVLALTVGATTALVVLADRLLFRPLTVAHSDRLVQVLRPAAAGGLPQESFPGALVDQLREAAKPFGSLLAVGYLGDESLSLTPAGFQPEPVRTQSIDARLPKTLGLAPAIGRLFERADSDAGAEPVAVISWDYWQKRYMRSRDVVGRTLRRRGKSFRIIGVFQRGFSELDIGSSPDIWFPIPAGQGGQVLVDLREQAHPGQLEAALAPTFDQYLKQVPPAQQRQGNARYLARHLTAVDASRGMSVSSVQRQFGASLMIVTLASVVLLIIGCANAGLLLLALYLRRNGELAVRVALGAGGGRLVRQIVLETMILTATGCLLGSAIAPSISQFLVTLASNPDRPIRLAWQWDLRFLAVVFSIGLLTTAFCVVVPALRLRLSNPVRSIYNPNAPVVGRLRAEYFLIAGQAALAVILLAGAGLLQSTWRNLIHLNPGFKASQVLVAELQWEREGDRTYTNSVYRTLVERISQLPEAASVSISGWSYFGDNTRRTSIVPDGLPAPNSEEGPLCEFLSVGPEFFATMGVPLLRGRDFNANDTVNSPLVAILNESAKVQYFGSADAIGKRFSIFDPKQKIDIIGVAADTKLNSLREGAPPMVYMPFFQSEFRGTPDTPASIEIRLRKENRISTEELQQTIRTSAPGLAARRVRPLSALLGRSLVRERLLSVLSAGFGTLGLLLAAFGLGGVVAQSTASRLKEFGIRLALGATNRDLIVNGLWHALRPVVFGSVLGAVLSPAVTRLMRSLLFGVEPFDPLVMSGATLVFLAVTTCAAFAPLTSVLRSDVVGLLRHE